MTRKKVSSAERAAQLLIADRITKARERLRVTKQDFANAYGVARQTVQFWERGDHLPPAHEIPKLCKLLGIDANELFDVSAPALDKDALRRELLELAERNRPVHAKEGAARKVPTKRGRLAAPA